MLHGVLCVRLLLVLIVLQIGKGSHIVGSVDVARNVVVFLHAKNEDNRDPFDRVSHFEEVVRRRGAREIAFVLPKAPVRETCQGQRQRQWYTLPCDTHERKASLLGDLSSSMALVASLVEQVAALPHSPRVHVSGFSQGGALALAVTTQGAPVHSCIVFSGYLIDFERTAEPEHAPVFWHHHARDHIVPFAFAERGFRRLSGEKSMHKVEAAAAGPHHFSAAATAFLEKVVLSLC